MRQSRLRRYWNRLQEIRKMKELSRDDLLKKLGAAQAQAGRAQGLVQVQVPAEGQAISAETFSFKLVRKKLRQWRRREGRYLLRSNLTAQKSSELWQMYLMLAEIEAAFKNLKGDLRIRPVFHRKESRVEAHIFVAFLSYCLHVTLRRKLHASAPGLTLTLRGRRNPKSDAAIPNSATIHSGNHGTSRVAVPAITTVAKNATSSASSRIEK